MVLLGLAAVGVGLAVARSSSAAAEGEVSRGGFDPFGLLASALYSGEGALGLGLSMTLSDPGLAQIAQREGLRLAPYHDAAGLPTIGYGHLIGPLEDFGSSITPEQALELLRADAAAASAAVNALVAVPLTQEQFDALVSLVFNIGAGQFRRSTLLALLNSGDYAGAAAQFDVWRKAGGEVNSGLVARRSAERQQFEAGLA